MPRIAARPSLAWMTLALLLVTGGIVGATQSSRVSPKLAATCTGYGYGQTTPTVSLSAAPKTIFARDTVNAFGWLGMNGCGLPGEVVRLQRRPLVNEKPAGSFVTVASATTNADGLFAIPFKPWYNTIVRVVVPAQNGHPSVTSVTNTIRVRPRISVFRPIGPATQRQVITGSVTPNKAGQRVSLYRVTRAGNVLLASTTLTSNSTYRFSVRLPKGYTNLLVYLRTTSTNTVGYVKFRAYRT